MSLNLIPQAVLMALASAPGERTDVTFYQPAIGAYTAATRAALPEIQPLSELRVPAAFAVTELPSDRDMHTDRPDTTESPRTVPRGCIQLELSAFEWSRDKHGPDPDSTDSRRIAIAPLNLKLGVTDSIDFQLVLEPWTRIRSGDDDETAGFGDITLRTKFNIWGNDEGTTALGLMPFMTFPTGADGLSAEAIEGGLILPFAIDLDDKTGAGVMAEFDLVHDPDNARYEMEFLHTAVLSRDLWSGLAGFLEYAGLVSMHGRDYIATANTGLTYELTPDMVLDAGVRIGLTSAADDVEVFTGVSLRF